MFLIVKAVRCLQTGTLIRGSSRFSFYFQFVDPENIARAFFHTNFPAFRSISSTFGMIDDDLVIFKGNRLRWT